MIGCLRTRVRKQPIIALYFESELVLKFYNLEARLVAVYVNLPVKLLACVFCQATRVSSECWVIHVSLTCKINFRNFKGRFSFGSYMYLKSLLYVFY